MGPETLALLAFFLLGLQFAAGYQYVPTRCNSGLSTGYSMNLQVFCTAEGGVEVSWSPNPGENVGLLQIEYQCRAISDPNDVTTDILLHNSQRVSDSELVPETSHKDVECTISGCYDSWFTLYSIPPLSHTCHNSPEPDIGVSTEPTTHGDLSTISSISTPTSSIEPSASTGLPLPSTNNSTPSSTPAIATASVGQPSATPVGDTMLDGMKDMETHTGSVSSVQPTSITELRNLPGTVTSSITATIHDSVASTATKSGLQLQTSGVLQPTPLTDQLRPTANGVVIGSTNDHPDLETAVYAVALVTMAAVLLMGAVLVVFMWCFMWHCYAERKRSLGTRDCEEAGGGSSCKQFILIA